MSLLVSSHFLSCHNNLYLGINGAVSMLHLVCVSEWVTVCQLWWNVFAEAEVGDRECDGRNSGLWVYRREVSEHPAFSSDMKKKELRTNVNVTSHIVINNFCYYIMLLSLVSFWHSCKYSESGSFFSHFFFYYSKVHERGKQISSGKKKFNMDPKKVNFYHHLMLTFIKYNWMTECFSDLEVQIIVNVTSTGSAGETKEMFNFQLWLDDTLIMIWACSLVYFKTKKVTHKGLKSWNM